MTDFEKSYIYEYYNGIQDGTYNVGVWIKKIFKLIIENVENGIFFFDEKKSKTALIFIESFCHHSKGRNDLLRLELWQKAIVQTIFGILNKDGRRQFREIVIIVARKNGKSLFASAIMNCMAFIDGEYGADLYCLAPKLEQANIVFDNFFKSIISEKDLMDLCKKRRTDVYIEQFNTVIKPLAFNSKKTDGLNPHFVVCDEIASWEGEGGLRMYEVMKSALGARTQPMILSISTAGYVNDSIYDELMVRSTSFLNGNSEETQLLPFLYMIDDVDKWDDLKELEKSNPNLGVSVSRDYMQEEIRIAKGSISKKAEFLTKYCNIKQNNVMAWLDYKVVDDASHDDYRLEDFANCYAVGGVDLSQTTDLTCASIVIEKGGEEYVFSQFFMPRNRVKTLTELDKVPYDIYIKHGYLTESGENYVDYRDVRDWFITLRKKYKIMPMRIGYDRYSAQYFVDDMDSKGYVMDDVYQGWNLAPTIRIFEGKLRDGHIHIGKNQLLKQHFLNVALKYESDNTRFKPCKIKPSYHIDGFVSVIDALTVKSKYFAEIKNLITNERRR